MILLPISPPLPPPAHVLLARARAEARASGRNVLVRFGAPWCGPCRAFHDALDRPAMARVVRETFVVVDLAVQTPGVTNPEADDLLNAWTHGMTGIPYYAVLSPDYRRLRDSFEWTMHGSEQKAGDLGWFLHVARRTSSKVSLDDLEGAAREAGVKIAE